MDGAREQGVVEKLLTSYGFIQCLEREGSLFFHYSEVAGAHSDLDSLRPGDEVEFAVRLDRRSEKLVAFDVVRLPPGSLSLEMVEDQILVGEIARPAEIPRSFGRNSDRGGDNDRSQGVIKLEEGASSSLPRNRVKFAVADQSDPSLELRNGDQVSLKIATSRRTGRMHAVEVTLLERAPVTDTLGIIASIKDGYGFLARADVDEQIFFHFSEFRDLEERPQLGDCVSFEVGMRQNKPIALALRLLPPGSVSLETVSEERCTGTVSQALRRPNAKDKRGMTDAMLGQITMDQEPVEGDDAAAEAPSPAVLPFGDRDMLAVTGEERALSAFSLRKFDKVEFSIAEDKRNKKRRATNIVRTAEGVDPDDVREQGVISTLKDGYGFIKCAERDARLFFHFSELLDRASEPRYGDEVEFSVTAAPKQSQGDGRRGDKVNATRVKFLPPGTVKFQVESDKTMVGEVTKVPCLSDAAALDRTLDRRRSRDPSMMDPGIISMRLPDGSTKLFQYKDHDVTDIRSSLREGDKVRFNVVTQKRTGAEHAVNIVLEEAGPNSSQRQEGFVSSLKDQFGFIENLACDREFFFHFSECVGGADDLKLAMRVSFQLAQHRSRSSRSGQPKLNALKIKKVDPETVADVEVLEEQIMQGRVARSLTSADGSVYGGRIEYTVNSDGKTKDAEDGDAEASLDGQGEAAAGADASAGGSADGPDPPAQTDSSAAASANADADAAGPVAEKGETLQLPFGITSLKDPHVSLQPGEEVAFRIAVQAESGSKRAVQIERAAGSKATLLRARVAALKPGYGFLNHQVEAGQKLFFHTKNVVDGVDVAVGDEVEFELSYNGRSEKYTAINVRKLGGDLPSERPSHLLRKKPVEDGEKAGPKFGISRQPSGPDGSRGFTRRSSSSSVLQATSAEFTPSFGLPASTDSGDAAPQ